LPLTAHPAIVADTTPRHPNQHCTIAADSTKRIIATDSTPRHRKQHCTIVADNTARHRNYQHAIAIKITQLPLAPHNAIAINIQHRR